MTHLHDEDNLDGIAVVGLSGRFPGAKSVDEFWRNLVNGVETISRFREEELEFSAACPTALSQGQKFIRARAVLEDADRFDAEFFGIYPREAELMDPQHRFFLESAWEAVENAGYDPGAYPGLIGVYAGLSLNTYLLYNLCADRAFTAGFAGDYQVGSYQVMLGNDKDFLPTRVSYKLNLKGPSMAIQTACSTSLVAVCQACTSLLNYQCDMALAGGVSISFPQKRDYLYQDEAMVSADGMCRVFDAEACGTVFGHGVAVVLLKRLSDAVADRDRILAVIKGFALNNDGARKIGYAAPSVKAQAEVIALAQAVAGVEPETVSYIEAHGTATPLGDPVEVAALTEAFRMGGAKRSGYCAIGTCKTHIGHLDVAAGATGLIKTILQLQHGLIPPLLHFRSPNPKIDFADSPFFPVTELMEWKRGETPRRAGVSAFGVGGTNAHVVVEEAPPPVESCPSRPVQLLVLSARTQSALEAMAANLAAHLDEHPEVNLADVAFTLQRGRKPFAHRFATVVSTASEAVSRLRSLGSGPVYTGKAMGNEPSMVFLLPGQGTQHIDMGRELYQGEPVFRAEVDRCAEILRCHLDLDLCRVLYPTPEERTSAETRINMTWLAQPAIFVVEYALARLWMSWGVMPAVLIGHSIGEYVAAVIAESLTLEDALALLAVRARLMQDVPGGSMLTIRLGAEQVEAMLPDGASMAAINSPSLCTVSGPTELLEGFRKELECKDIAARFLHTSHAFHSAMMDPMLDEFSVAARGVPSKPPKLQWVSTCSGRCLSAEDLAGGEYWVRQVRQPVRFSEALDAVIEELRNILLEVGPGQTLCQLARQHHRKPECSNVISTLGTSGEPGGDLTWMLTALGRLWLAGANVNWEGFYANEQRSRVALPTYPFERKRYWIEPAGTNAQVPQNTTPPACSQPQEAQPSKEPEMETATPLNTDPPPSRKDRFVGELRDLFQSYSGADHSGTDENESFLDLGFDSLLLTQASQGVLKRFGVKVTFRQMLGELSTLGSLAAFLDGKLPPDPLPQATSRPVPPEPDPHPVHPEAPRLEQGGEAPSHPIAAPSQLDPVSSADGSLIATVIQQQMAIMTQQLDLLRRGGSAQRALFGIAAPGPRSVASSGRPVITAVNMGKESRFGPFKAIEKGAAGGLTERQQAALETLIARYNRRTAKSKALAQEHRACFCDPRAAGNFRLMWKEMVYPIVCAKSKGSRIWDVDGNEYIDVTMGFGANYLGHSPDFVMKALEEQMKLGVEIGPQSPLAGEVARMICDFTGLDRATFCNTGSEAVMAALRVARTVTGREKIVYFHGDYHGIFDEVLGRPALVDGQPGAMPIAQGIPHLANVIILEYGSRDALDTIRACAGEIAGVVVEPVQSRHPDLQPREFLHDLRRVTREHDIPLIFDEVITGFRVAPGGAQEYFGVKADLATYGKVIGGGMPIGVLAGSSTYMDVLDGGFWQFGDDSSPPSGVTFFAGTFVRHPLAMAAVHAVLKHLKAAGPSLQERINKLTARFVDRVNDFFQVRQLPMRLQTFSAMFYYDFHPDLKHAGLLFYYLRDRGVHVWEGRVGHLSIAHTDQDMDRVLEAFQESVEEMQNGGFLPPSTEALKSDGAGSPLMAARRMDGLRRVPIIEAQREIWLASRLSDMASCAFNESTILHLRGPLDMEAMRLALHGIIARHEALRTTFSPDGESQCIAPSAEPDITVADFSNLETGIRESRVSQVLRQETAQPFDLEHGPLMRIRIIKLEEKYHMMVTTAHHIVCDGWSFDVMMTDLSSIYSMICRGEQDRREMPMQISEYALWQEREKNSPEVLADEIFWIEQFKDSVPVLEFMGDHRRPSIKTYRGARETQVLDEVAYAEIKRAGARQGATLYATLLAAYAVLLYRLTGQEDMVIGILAAGQSIVGCHDLVGHCTNLLPLRVRVDGDLSFRAFLAEIKHLVLDAYEHQRVTFGTLINRLNLRRDPSRTPLVSVMFNVDPAIHGMKFKDLDVEYVANPRCGFQFDLGFNLVAADKNLISECDYTTDLFDAETISRWLRHYHTLISNIVRNPDQPLSKIPLLGDAELGQLLVEWNETGTDYPREAAIHQIFEAQAQRAPDGAAVVFENDSVTYGELNRRANHLAHYLRSIGVGAETIVGAYVDRSIDMVVSLLGILKAGGAYLPLDPTFPGDRLAFMLEDSGAPIVITQDGLLEYLPKQEARAVVVLDRDWSSIAKSPGHNPNNVAGSNNLAYVMYTSGSTGKPKGVQILHGAVVNFLLSMQKEPGFTAKDRLLSVTTLSFDISVLEIFLPLVTGGLTVLITHETASDGKLLAAALARHEATVMQATPVTWRILLETGWKSTGRIKGLIGGEALPHELCDQLLEQGVELWNMYGPTETTIWSTIKKMELSQERISIGKPIDNTRVYVLDSNLLPVPIGVPGELHIGGDGLARGYLNRPELTSEKFIKDPFSDNPNARIYKTGDLAIYLKDGNLECLGRTDYQAKVRGFRVEPGEIETLLNRHPGIKDSAVVVRPDSLGENLLVAHVVQQDGSSCGVSDLRQYLREKLPDYMVPSRIMFLDELPLTPNGKINRKALPQVSEQRDHDLERSFVAPGDPLEMQLTKIWELVLGVKPIGIKDNFFEIGGHSLIAARLFARIEKVMGMNLPLATLYQAPTIELLAKTIRERDWCASWCCLVPIRAGGSKPPLFFVHGAGGNVLLYRELVSHLCQDQPFYGLQAKGLDGKEPPCTSFEDMAAHYIEEVTSLQPDGPYYLGGYCLGGAIALEMAQQLRAQGREVSLLAMIETYNTDPSKGLLPFYYNLLHTLQNLKYHWDNIWLLNMRDSLAFLSTKSKVSLGRMKSRVMMRVSRVARAFHLPFGERYPHIDMTKVNDQVHLDYTPKPYKGKITLFRPKKHYKGYDDYEFGWGTVAEGGVEVRELPVNPRGSLVEPFVQKLAEELKICIENTLQRTSAE
jgi:amino acid adenylation domain-containing protein